MKITTFFKSISHHRKNQSRFNDNTLAVWMLRSSCNKKKASLTYVGESDCYRNVTYRYISVRDEPEISDFTMSA